METKHYNLLISGCREWNINREKKMNLYYLDVNGKNYYNYDFSDTSFGNSILTYCVFYNCNLTNADFRKSRLDGTVFNQCNLTGAKFGKSILSRVNFIKCEMKDVTYGSKIPMTQPPIQILDMTTNVIIFFDKHILFENVLGTEKNINKKILISDVDILASREWAMFGDKIVNLFLSCRKIL